MGLRERTPRAKKMKRRRCPKCGAHLNRLLKRCKRCSQQVKLTA
jgi:predicted RNA-binding Zn-ribbon protein involved in translation (DUF1610 family)